MSLNKHKSFRKVLEIQKSTSDYNGVSIPVTTILWCLADSLTSRTIKTKHIGISTYIGSVKFNGISAWSLPKAVSLNLKNPLLSKFFETVNLKYSLQESGNKAYMRFILGKDTRCKNLIGVVQWWSGTTGSILIEKQVYRVYACNIKGAKTWYPETACMFLNEGETVMVNLSDMGDHLTCSVTKGGHFDSAKWNSLDHSKLAFKCNEDGQAINGLFA